MRIAYLSTDFGIPIYGSKGASIHVREFSRAMTSIGHDVEIITCRAGGAGPAGFSVPVHELPLSKPDKLLFGLLRDDPAAGEPAAREIRSMLYGATIRHLALPPLHQFQPDAIYERYALLGTAGGSLARALGVPHILEVNAPLSEEQASHRDVAFAQTTRAVEKHMLDAADRVIAVSEPLKQWMIGIGVDSDRITVLPNGIDIDRFAVGGAGVRERLGLSARPVVGFVGTLKSWHGTATLIRAVAMLERERGDDSAPRLLLVGDGPQRASLEQVAREEGITGLTTFTGVVPHEAMPAHLAAMDVAVAPYDQTGNFYFSPLKLFEYMAAGRPIVAAAIGQIMDFVRDGETGLLYPPGDIPALASRLAQLLDNPTRAQALGRAAQHEARLHRSWEGNARMVVQLVRAEQAPAGLARPTGVLTEGIR
ncbi:MAG: glycosyltransferase family 4 protein [Chloroflexia bacterium]|nr:glycosyltransferase family 4 protein [Chloroflexia bacterium]